jgi:4-diphosphocytidyl-2-C-methyl-D-erythritol kinase
LTLFAKAPAKVNLQLEILGKRPDGYHDLRSVMASVSLYDDIAVTLTPCRPGEETYTASAAGVEGENLAAKAARLFGIPGRSIDIAIEKRIPVGAGLGGGSSDAAAVLRVLDGWAERTGCCRPSLCKLALELGSDVPYCLRGGVCLAQGRGEILTPLPPMGDCRVVLCVPPVFVSTADMFTKIDRTGARFFEDVTDIPEVLEIKRTFTETGAEKAAMSGSGPAVFGIFSDECQAKTAQEKLLPTFPKTFLLTFV